MSGSKVATSIGSTIFQLVHFLLVTLIKFLWIQFLPTDFCVRHFPEHDTTVILVDESGKEFGTKFLKARHGLSGGWRGFSAAQKLLQGDILFFHLVGSCKLQVMIGVFHVWMCALIMIM